MLNFVNCFFYRFMQMPLASYWRKLAVKNMLVETKLVDEAHPSCEAQNPHWIAKVIDFAGKQDLMRMF